MASANRLYPLGKEQFLSALLDLTGITIKVAAYDISDHSGTITGASNATPIVITQATHGYSNGDRVVIQGIVGNTAANEAWVIANVATNTYELTTSVGSGAYSSGGEVMNLTADQFLSDLTGAGVVSTGTLASKTVAAGVFDAADTVFSSVSGDAFQSLIIYYDSGVAGTSTLIAYMDQSSGSFSITPSGGDITVNWNASGIFEL